MPAYYKFRNHRGVPEGQPRHDRAAGALDHLHGRRVGSRHDVVHEKVQVRRRAIAVRRCRRDDGEEQHGGEGASRSHRRR